MNLKDKQLLIEENCETILSALNTVLDTYYDFLSPVITEDNSNIREDFFGQEYEANEAKELATQMLDDTKKYEKIRKIINQKKFQDLNPVEIAYVGIVLNFCENRAETQIQMLDRTKDFLSKLKEKLQSPIDKD